MKWALIIVACIDVLLLLAAGVRFATANENTPPLIDFNAMFMGGGGNDAASDGPGIGETGKGGDVVNHLKGRSWEAEETAGFVGGGGGGNAEYTGNQLQRASDVVDGREDDLDDAKAKMRKLPGGGG